MSPLRPRIPALRRATALATTMAAAALFFAPAAQASFGFLPGAAGFEASLTNEGGSLDNLAGTHPFAMNLNLAFNKAGTLSEGDLRDLQIALPSGLLANPAAIDECTPAQFHTPRVSPHETSLSGESCPDSSQVGVATVDTGYGGGQTRTFGVYNLVSPFGTAEEIGFSPFNVPVELTGTFREPEAALTFALQGLSQALNISAMHVTLWGTPWDHSHDELRGNCLKETEPGSSWGKCSTSSGLAPAPQSYLSLPSSCAGPLRWEASASSWQQPAAVVQASAESPSGLSGCVQPLTVAKVQLQTENAASATGLVLGIDVNDGGGFLNPPGIVRSPVKKAIVALPEGLTINPSLGSGLGVCTAADFARESATSLPGSGCPNASKIGDISIAGLLGLPEPVQGSLFLAKPYENPSGSLIGLYVVASSPRRGLFVHGTGQIQPDPQTGRLIATFEELPQLHYTHFSLSFREGQRAAMVSPPACGNYTSQLEMTPYSDPNLRLHGSSPLIISHGESGGACPGTGLRPFAPGLVAGSLNSQAGAYSPFSLHMTRSDAEQEITSYSAVLPPGLLGKLTGIPTCSDAQIEAAKQKTGIEEFEHPSCPPASEIGHTIAGYGVGGTLAYAPGRLFLAGPYHGSPISTVAIDSALVGPFDLGVITVRSAIRVDPVTAQASIDSSGSDPIPHILKGIPLHLRDIRVAIDRPDFIVNPTSCDPLGTTSILTGSGSDPFSSADDVPANSTDRFQVSNCSALGFSPKFTMALKGSTRRGRYPSLRAIVEERPGDVNIGRAIVALPHSEFLAQGHIREICTLRQFASSTCPPDSIYGKARAFTSLLAEPLEGPVYLRTSVSHEGLPEMVVALSGDGGIKINLLGRIDSTPGGGIRANFETLPDAPASKFILTLSGGKTGLLENEVDICSKPSAASVTLIGQSNATHRLGVPLSTTCARSKSKKHKGHR